MSKKRRLVKKKREKEKTRKRGTKWGKVEVEEGKEGKEGFQVDFRESGIEIGKEERKGGRGIERQTFSSTTIGVSKACRHLGNMRCDRTVYCVSA